ncbi:MAG: peptidase dimerization domain-containing protein [Anaerobutyricum sp.]
MVSEVVIVVKISIKITLMLLNPQSKLKELSTRHNLRIVSLNGGTKHNAIPRNCELVIASEDEIKDEEISADGFKQVEKRWNLSLNK